MSLILTDGPLDDEGRPRLEWFRAAYPEDLSKWLWDHFFNNRFVESTSRYLEYIFQEEPLDSQLRSRLETQLVFLLKQFPSHFTSSAPPSLPSLIHGLAEILRFCYLWRFSSKKRWFREQLDMFNGRIEDAWPEELRFDLLLAVSTQYPGYSDPDAERRWKALLRNPSYSTVALYPGLARTFNSILRFLPEWYTYCPLSTRDTELRSLIEIGIEELGQDKLFAVLADPASSANFSPQLRCDLNQVAFSLLGRFIFRDSLSFRQQVHVDLLDLQWEIRRSEQDPRDGRLVEDVLDRKWPIELVYSEKFPESAYLRNLMKDFRARVQHLLDNKGCALQLKTTDNFEESRETGLYDRLKAVFCAPYLVPAEKRLKEGVLQFGWHRYFGLMTRHTSILMSDTTGQPGTAQVRTPAPLPDSRDNDILALRTMAFKTVFNKYLTQSSLGIIFANESYSIRDVVREGLEKSRSAPDSVAGSVKPVAGDATVIPREVVAKNQEHEEWCYAFDLGHFQSIRKDLMRLQEQDPAFKDVQIVRVEHDLQVPVGIGFTMYATPMLMEEGFWEKLYEALRSQIVANGVLKDQFVGALQSIGVVPGEAWEVEAELPTGDGTKKRRGKSHAGNDA